MVNLHNELFLKYPSEEPAEINITKRLHVESHNTSWGNPFKYYIPLPPPPKTLQKPSSCTFPYRVNYVLRLS